MKKRQFKLLSKKAQQSNWFMIVLVLAIITLVVVALALTGAFDKIANIFGQASDLEVVAQACGVYASQDLKTSYCNEFKKVEINGKTQYANCEYLENYAEFDGEGQISCNVKDIIIVSFCVNKKLDSDELVNGKQCGNLAPCETAIPGGLGGIWKSQTEGCPEDHPEEVTEYAKDRNLGANTNKICCVEDLNFFEDSSN
ncbi:hypothetical protein K9L16_00495 [Candidatus Pacearchaeota archaeon]|nr:hypothetical protein [Candidatus Pacearchaeota archaeon]